MFHISHVLVYMWCDRDLISIVVIYVRNEASKHNVKDKNYIGNVYCDLQDHEIDHKITINEHEQNLVEKQQSNTLL